MKASIIVPVYNTEQYLQQCVDSLLSQDFDDFEILLINDGSTDGSLNVCENYASIFSNVRVINKPNGGLSSARNTGVYYAQGDWVVFVDSDDYWTSNNCLKVLFENSKTYNSDVVRFEYQAVDDDGFKLYECTYNKKSIENRTLTPYELFHIGISGEFFSCLFLIKRKLVLDILFDEKRSFQEDIDFCIRLFALKNFNASYVSNKFYAYRKRSSSITSTPKIKNLEGSFSLSKTFDQYIDKISDIQLKKDYQYYSVMMYYWTLFTIAEPSFFKYRIQIYNELNINKLHADAICRLRRFKIYNKASILILLPPKISVYMIYCKTKFAKYCVK